MARIRTIKPDFWKDEKIMDCKPLERLLFIGLWNLVDDYGRFEMSPRTIRAEIFPEDEITAIDVRDMLTSLSARGLITIYSAGDRDYFFVTNWDKHQRIDNKAKPKFPAPFGDIPSEEKQILGKTSEGSEKKSLEGKGKERKGKDGNAAAVAPRPDVSPEIDYFRRMKEICGTSGGGLGKKLLDAKDGNIPLARAAAEQASTKADPREYIGAIIRGRGGGVDDLRARGEAW